MFLREGVLKTCSKFTGEHTCQNAISIKLLFNFIEIALWHGCSGVNLLHIFRTPFPRNTSGWLLLVYYNPVQEAKVLLRAVVPMWSVKLFPEIFRKIHCSKTSVLEFPSEFCKSIWNSYYINQFHAVTYLCPLKNVRKSLVFWHFKEV